MTLLAATNSEIKLAIAVGALVLVAGLMLGARLLKFLRATMDESCRGRQVCTKCRYSLAGITSGRCPECGTATEPIVKQLGKRVTTRDVFREGLRRTPRALGRLGVCALIGAILFALSLTNRGEPFLDPLTSFNSGTSTLKVTGEVVYPHGGRSGWPGHGKFALLYKVPISVSAPAHDGRLSEVMKVAFAHAAGKSGAWEWNGRAAVVQWVWATVSIAFVWFVIWLVVWNLKDD